MHIVSSNEKSLTQIKNAINTSRINRFNSEERQSNVFKHFIRKTIGSMTKRSFFKQNQEIDDLMNFDSRDYSKFFIIVV